MAEAVTPKRRTKADRRYDDGGPIVLMAGADGYVMVRRRDRARSVRRFWVIVYLADEARMWNDSNRQAGAEIDVTQEMADAGAAVIADAALDGEYGTGDAFTARRVYIAMRRLELERMSAAVPRSHPGIRAMLPR